jgi:hypothetical protein
MLFYIYFLCLPCKESNKEKSPLRKNLMKTTQTQPQMKKTHRLRRLKQFFISYPTLLACFLLDFPEADFFAKLYSVGVKY